MGLFWLSRSTFAGEQLNRLLKGISEVDQEAHSGNQPAHWAATVNIGLFRHINQLHHLSRWSRWAQKADEKTAEEGSKHDTSAQQDWSIAGVKRQLATFTSWHSD